MRPSKAPIEIRTDAAAMSAPIKFSKDNLILGSQSLILLKKLASYDFKKPTRMKA